MPNPGLTDDQCREVIDAYHRNGGHKGNAARDLKLNYRTYATRLLVALGRMEAITAKEGGMPKMRVSISQRVNSSGKRLRGVAIGDAHDGPRLDDKSRFKWIGRHIAEIEADFVIWIGDCLTFDSLCRYDDNATIAGQLKPSFMEDIDSGHAAFSAYDEGKQGFKPEIEHITLGNHEDRAISFSNRTPEMAGMLTGQIDRLFMSHNLTYTPYGVLYFVDDVAFTHVPLTRMGRAYGGVHAMSNIGNKSLTDIVYGHSHVGGKFVSEKIGTNNSVTVWNLGCSLPQGYVEPYVGHATSGWHYGVYELLIDQGRIMSDKHISMTELEDMYGD